MMHASTLKSMHVWASIGSSQNTSQSTSQPKHKQHSIPTSQYTSQDNNQQSQSRAQKLLLQDQQHLCGTPNRTSPTEHPQPAL